MIARGARAARGRVADASAEQARSARRRGRVARPRRRCGREVDSPHLPRRPVGRPARAGRSRPPRRGSCGASRSSSGARLYEHTPVTHCATTARRCWPRPRTATSARAAACSPPTPIPPLLRRIGALRRAGLRLRADDRAADRRAARGDRLARRQGLADCTNQFHYYRQTDDGRILWGGYDAVYHFRNGFGPSTSSAPPPTSCSRSSSSTPSRSSPGLRFSHRWGGAIDTCSRFSVFFGTAHGGKTLLRGRLHRARRRRDAVRRPGGARPGRRPRDRGDADRVRAIEAGAVPARAAALCRHHADAPRARRAPTATAGSAACGCGARPGRARLRLLAPGARPATRCRAAAASPRRLASSPSTSTSGPPIMKSVWTVETFRPAL